MTTTVTIKAGSLDGKRKVRISVRDSQSENVSYITESAGTHEVVLHGDMLLKVREVGGGVENSIVKA